MRDSDKFQPGVCPELSASLFSRVFFTWPSSLLELGSKKVLENDDIPPLCPPCTYTTQYAGFQKAWKKELHDTGSYDRVGANNYETNGNMYHEKRTTDQQQSSSTPPREPSLIWTVLKTQKWNFMFIQMLHIVCLILLWIAPMHLRTLISYVEKPWGGVQQGILLAASLFIIQGLDSIVYQQFIYNRNKLEITTQNILMIAIYKKSLRLSAIGRRSYPVGKMLTLVSTDAAEAGLAYSYVAWSFLSPLNIVAAFAQLFWLLGAASALSLVGCVVLVFMHVHIARLMQRLLKRRMEKQDRRMKLLTEILIGIKAIKLHAWEACFGDRVTRKREEELEVLSDVFLLKMPLLLSTTVAPFMVSVLTLGAYVFWNNGAHLDASVIFSTVSLLKILRRGLGMTPDFFNDVARLQTHVGRIQTFLLQDEQQQSDREHSSFTDVAVQIQSASFSWDKTLPPVLQDISVSVPRGGLVAVVGQVGSGKSALISAILREMSILRGTIDIQGSIAYTPQQAWVQNNTVEQNIVFGHEFNNERYQAIIDACALRPDLDTLPGGDQTEIGEKGVNLSGGQKQRVSLARAVYSDGDIHLLDDPLSAVDAHVGKHIFDKVIGNGGLLRDKTRILVTHNVSVLSRVDTILVINNHRVEERGSYEELMSRDSVLKQVVSSSPSGDKGQYSWNINEKDESTGKWSWLSDGRTDPESKKTLGKLMEEESHGLNAMKSGMLSKFLNAFGSLHWAVIVGLYLMNYVTVSLANVWLSVWAQDHVHHHNATIHIGIAPPSHSNACYIGIYFALGVLQAAILCAYSCVLRSCTVKSSRNLHSKMLNSVLRSPIKFFDTTPLGRITNRFSQDFNIIDKDLPFTFEQWMDTFFQTLCSMCIVCYSAPTVVSILIPMIYFCVKIQRYFTCTSRQLKTAYVKSLSGVLSFFSESCQGVEIIRAFKEQQTFTERFVYLAETYHKFQYYNFVSNRWLSMRMSFVSHIVLASTALLIFLQGDVLNSGVMGLALSFAYETSNDLRMFIIRCTKVDLMSVSIENIMEYASMETENESEHLCNTLSPNWPSQGAILCRDLSVRHRPGLQLALTGVDFSVKPAEKVGIVGRTGAGKSSLILSLFRLMEPAEGALIIDGVSIADVGLREVRSRLSIIPQDPILFSESLRVNLDPMESYSDQEIWTALRHAHLDMLVSCLPGCLRHRCHEGGKNFSIGQRQLLCLARTLLRKSKILVLDEATAAVDMETDDLIQQTIRSEFKDCTVLTIAHRLNTVMDYDRILVLNRGRVDAYDTPANLLQNTDGLFYSLARHAGII